MNLVPHVDQFRGEVGQLSLGPAVASWPTVLRDPRTRWLVLVSASAALLAFAVFWARGVAYLHARHPHEDAYILFRYVENPNGSINNIAGIINERGNVLGMMPHPERMVEPAHGGTDGRRLFEGLLEAVGA